MGTERTPTDLDGRTPTHDTNLTEAWEGSEDDCSNHGDRSKDNSACSMAAERVQSSGDTDDASARQEALEAQPDVSQQTLMLEDEELLTSR